jgi:hypothetical protein
VGFYAFLSVWIFLSILVGYLSFDQYRSFWKWTAISILVSPIIASFTTILLPSNIPIVLGQIEGNRSFYIFVALPHRGKHKTITAFAYAVTISVITIILLTTALS